MSKFSAIVLVSALALPPAAVAGPYLGVGIGGSRLESSLSDLNLVPNIANDANSIDQDFTSTDVGFQFLAGWRFGTYLAVEAGWVDFGEAKQLYELPENCNSLGCQSREWTAKAKSDGWQAFLVGFLPLGESVEAYAKIGALGWDTDLDGFERQAIFVPPPAPTGTPNDAVSFSDDGTDLAGGIGLNLKTESAFSVRTEFTWFDVENTDQAWLLSLTAIYNFGGGD